MQLKSPHRFKIANEIVLANASASGKCGVGNEAYNLSAILNHGGQFRRLKIVYFSYLIKNHKL